MNNSPRILALILMSLLLSGSLCVAATWAEALSKMPLGTQVQELNRTNCVGIMLEAFRSNSTVKALVFMPGATDEFYMFRRARAALPQGNSTLLDAVQALTNQTFIRATFRAPILLLHTAEDALEPGSRITDMATATRLQTGLSAAHVLCNDWDWDALQPRLRSALKLDLRPWKGSPESWHFYRHSFAGWNLSGWEALECAAWAGKSQFTVYKKRVVFEPDMRVEASLRFETEPHAANPVNPKSQARNPKQIPNSN